MDVGDELIRKKEETPHGEWGDNLTRALSLTSAAANMTASRLMLVARHRELIRKKEETPQGEFVRRAGQLGLARQRVAELMRLAQHRELIRKKGETPRGEWVPNLARVLGLKPTSANSQAAKLMLVARHRGLIEEHKPSKSGWT